MVRKTKRVLAVILAIATIWTGMPLEGVFAQEVDGKEVIGTEQSVSEESVQEESPQMEEGADNQGQLLIEDSDAVGSTETEQGVVQEDIVDKENTGENAQSAQIEYVVVENSNITTPGTQNIVVGIAENATVTEAVLTYTNEETQESFCTQMSQAIEGAVLFTMDFSNGQSGVYNLESVEYIIDGVKYRVNFGESGMETKFGVDRNVETNPDAVVVEENDDVESSEEFEIVTIDEDGNTTSMDTIGDAIKAATEETNEANGQQGVWKNPKGANGNIVVVLDPGHDNAHAGTQASGLREEQLNLKIAKYCREELQQYQGVTVYMTRGDDGSCPYPGTTSTECNARRVAFAQSVGANVYVSLHLNSASASANGAKVYYPNSNYRPDLGAQGEELASIIQEKLVALGLKDNGIHIRNTEKPSDPDNHYADGSLADYYGVIKSSKKAGIPAIIVEHAFQSNANDVANFLSSEEGFKKLGVADATGIAEYFGLHKTTLQLNGVFYSEKSEWIEAGVSWQSISKPVQFRWLAYNLEKGTWTTVSDWSSADYITWRPEKGNYWLRVEAKAADGSEANWTIEYESKRDYTKHYVDIGGIYCEENSDGIRAGAVHNTTDTGAKFRWLVYDINKGTWTTISDWNQSEWVTWKPAKGNYWLRVEAKTGDGVESNYTIAYNPKRSYNGKYVEISGIYCVEESYGIRAGAVHETNDSAVQYRWMVYDVKKGTWTTISDWKQNEWVTWTPKKGNYWLRVEAKTSDGKEENYTIAYNPSRGYNYYYVNVQGIYCEENTNGIRAGAVHETNDSTTEYRWMVYDVNKGTWTTISDWNQSEWVTWKPELGNYWLRVEARTRDGGESNYTIAYNPVRDYSRYYVELQGIYAEEKIDGIRAGAVHVTNDAGAKFRWLVYDINKGTWTTISDWQSSEWVTWNPDEGNYWLRVEARTTDGRLFDYTIAKQIEKYMIMGESNTSLSKMVAYYKKNAVYPAFYQSSDAPTIEIFCQMYLQECAAEGVKAEVAFCQAMKETGFLRFGGDVKINQYNFAGLGATGNGNPGNSFPTVRIGIRAQVQHLKAYASTEPLRQECVDERFKYVKRGTAPYVEWLGQKENPQGYGWATAKDYGYSLKYDYMYKLLER